MRYFPEYFPDYREVLDPAIRWIDRTISTLAFLAFTKKQAEKTSGKSKRKKQAERASRHASLTKTLENKKRILLFLKENGKTQSIEIAEHLQLSQARVRVLLSDLIDEGKILPQGNGRSRYYILSEVKD